MTIGDVIALLVGMTLIGLSIYSFVVCWQKGRYGMFWWSFAGIIMPLVGILHLIGALRIARPDSSWARKHYAPGSKKLAIAEKRFA